MARFIFSLNFSRDVISIKTEKQELNDADYCYNNVLF